MAVQSYPGLGKPEQAIPVFTALAPYAETLRALQMECGDDLGDRSAFGVAIEALDTAAFHFTRRPRFYFQIDSKYPWPRTPSNGRLKELDEAIAAFEGLQAYRKALGRLRVKCRPFGADYHALTLPVWGLDTACYHFTRMADFYAIGDTAGPARRRPA